MVRVTDFLIGLHWLLIPVLSKFWHPRPTSTCLAFYLPLLLSYLYLLLPRGLLFIFHSTKSYSGSSGPLSVLQTVGKASDLDIIRPRWEARPGPRLFNFLFWVCVITIPTLLEYLERSSEKVIFLVWIFTFRYHPQFLMENCNIYLLLSSPPMFLTVLKIQ